MPEYFGQKLKMFHNTRKFWTIFLLRKQGWRVWSGFIWLVITVTNVHSKNSAPSFVNWTATRQRIQLLNTKLYCTFNHLSRPSQTAPQTEITVAEFEEKSVGIWFRYNGTMHLCLNTKIKLARQKHHTHKQ